MGIFQGIVVLLAVTSGIFAFMPRGGKYVRMQAIGDDEKLDRYDENRRDLNFLRSDYDPCYIQEVKTSISVSCYTEAGHIDDTVFTATCPPGCDQIVNNVIGTGAYTENSAICRAAIHDGVIEADVGGAVAVRKIEGRSSYRQSTRNGISSEGQKGGSKRSIIFQNADQARRPTYDVTCVVQGDWIRDADFNIICPSGCGVMGDRIWGNQMYSDASSLCAAAIHNGAIQDSIGGKVHVMKTGFQNRFGRSTKNGITSYASNIGKEAFQLEKFDVKEATMTHEVSCYFQADHIMEDVFTVICPPGCEEVTDKIHGTGIYTRDSFVCASAIHAGRISAPVGGLITVYKTAGKIGFVGSIQNEVSSTGKPHGANSFIFQDTTVREPDISTVGCAIRGDNLRDDVATLACPANCDHETYEVWGTETYKSDSYICAAAAHAGVIDVSRGGSVTVKRVPGLQSYEASTHQRIVGKSFGKWDKSFIFADNIQKTSSVLAVNCDFTADLMNDTVFSIQCPSACSNVAKKVWGDGIYTSDSPLCTAATHDGYIKDSIGGVVTVHKVEGKANYRDALRSNIQSFSYGSWSKSSVIFQRPSIEVESVYPVTCETRADFMVDDVFTVICPAGCDAIDNDVWGSNEYTDDSYVCGAAIHNGRIDADVGGQVTLGKIPGLDSYVGTERNSIRSNDKTKWRKSIIFRDIVQRRASTYTISCKVEGSMIWELLYTIICPPGCLEEAERVWGTDVYTEDSYICASAIHAGKISNDVGGELTVETVEDDLRFASSARNGIVSKSYDKFATGFRFL